MKKLIVLLPFVFFLVSCGGGEKDYWPLNTGNVWEYKMVTTVTAPDTTITMTDTMKTEVTNKTTLNNNTEVYEVITTSRTFADTSYQQKTDDYIFSYENKADTEPDTIIALPLEENKSWNIHKDSSYTETMKVLGKESVTVPAGTYDDCWKGLDIYTDGVRTETSYVWIAPDVGWVKMTMTEADTNFTMETKVELINVTIK